MPEEKKPTEGESPKTPDGGSQTPAGQPSPAAQPAPASAKVELESFAPAEPKKEERAIPIERLKDVSLNVKVELGRANLNVEDVLKLNKGSVVELDKLTGDPLDLYINNALVARGEILVINDNFAIRIIKVLAPGETEKK